MPEEEWLLTWEGRVGGVLASPGGRADAKGRAVARDALAFPGQAVAGGGSGTCLGRNRSFPRGVFTWEGVIPSLGRLAWQGVIPSLGGLTWELFIFTWELFRLREAKLFEAKLLLLVLFGPPSYISFLSDC